MTKRPILILLGCLVVLATGLLPFAAYAQQTLTSASCPATDNTISNIFCHLTQQFGSAPKTLVVLSYMIAAVLLVTGLLNLKAYGDDPSQTPMRSIVMKFVLAALFISLPLAIQVFVGSVTGTDSLEHNTALAGRPCLMKSSLMQMRGGSSPCQ